MASFKAKAVGGPDDGLIIDLIRAPQDREQITRLPEARRRSGARKVYAIYTYRVARRAWIFVGYSKRQITSDISG